MSTEKSGQICTYFLQNACSRGESCRFLHENDPSSTSPEVAASSKSDTLTPTCVHFLRGACRYGDRCREPHSAGDASGTTVIEKYPEDTNIASGSFEYVAEDPWTATNDPWAVKDPWGTQTVSANGWPAECSTSIARQKAASPQAPQPAPGYRTKPCWYYSQAKCLRGDSCNFHHPVVRLPSRNGTPNSPRDRDLSRSNGAPASPQVHHHFASASPIVGPSQEPCQFFVRGQCPRSDACPFVHGGSESRTDAGEIIQDDTASSSPCQLFLKGKCMRGDTCPFLHEEVAEEASAQSQIIATAPCQLYAMGKCTRGFACPFFHAPADVVLSSPDMHATDLPCQFFVQGSCQRGDDCPFPHVAMEPSKSINSEVNTSQDHVPNHNQDYAQTCKYFDRGHCARGSACRYLHNGVPVETARSAENFFPSLSCKFFLLGECRKGGDCMYTHTVVDQENVHEQPFNTWGDEPSASLVESTVRGAEVSPDADYL